MVGKIPHGSTADTQRLTAIPEPGGRGTPAAQHQNGAGTSGKQITRSRRRAGVGLLAILGAAIVAWPALDAHLAVRHLDMQSIPTQSWGLLALGAVLLLFRK